MPAVTKTRKGPDPKRRMAAENFANLPDMLSREEICDLFKITDNTLTNHIRKGIFPKQDTWAGPRAPRWYRKTVIDVLVRNSHQPPK